MHFGPFGCLTKLGAKRGELVQKFENEVPSEFFATNAPDPPHWTLNLCFGAFCTIWVHLGVFGCLTKLGAKWAELVKKFMPRTRCTPSDHKLMFWFILFGTFGTVWLPYETRCKTGQTSAKVCAVKSRRIFFETNAPDPPH